MKKMKSLLMMALALLLVTSCGTKTATKPTEDKTYVIGVNQLVSHPALDDALKGFQDRFNELGLKCTFEVGNAQGELPNAVTIATNYVSNKVDLIYAIATPSAQASKQVSDEKTEGKTPIVFSAVSNPVESGLVESVTKSGGCITGVSDQGPVREQVSMFKKLAPEAKVIGVIYSTKESNSEMQLKELEVIAKELGYTLKVSGISQISEIAPALDVLLPDVDVMYLLSDNMIASSITLVSEKMIAAKKISVVAEESQVGGGALVSMASSYYEMGKQAADMAKEILVDGKKPSDMPFQTASNLRLVINEETEKALGLNVNELLK